MTRPTIVRFITYGISSRGASYNPTLSENSGVIVLIHVRSTLFLPPHQSHR